MVDKQVSSIRTDASIESGMRPGKMSAGGFLGSNEKLADVISRDDQAVRRLGLTHEKIADRIEHFIKAVNYPTPAGQVVDGKYLVGGNIWRGMQECPWKDTHFMPYSSKDLFVVNQDTGEKLNFPGAIVHLIREHCFYEGKESPYRVDPETAARVLDIK